MKQVVFPTYRMRAGRRNPFRRYQLSYPVSLLKLNGVWQEITTPAAEQVDTAEKYFQGGRTYLLTDEEASALAIPSQYLVSV